MSEKSEIVIGTLHNAITPLINNRKPCSNKNRSNEKIANSAAELLKLQLCNIQSFSNKNKKSDKTSEA